MQITTSWTQNKIQLSAFTGLNYFFLAGLGCLRCDDSPLPGHSLPALVVQQEQVRVHRRQEGLEDCPTHSVCCTWARLIPHTSLSQHLVRASLGCSHKAEGYSLFLGSFCCIFSVKNKVFFLV
jgi:hypothetical protein